MKLAYILFPVIYAFVFILTMLIVNPGYRLSNILMLTLMTAIVFVIYLTASSITKKAYSPVKKGALIGLLIGIIAFLGAFNWNIVCHYGSWCYFIRTLSIFGFMNLPFYIIWAVFIRVLYHSFYTAFIYPVIFVLLGMLFGKIYQKNKRIFWIAFIISLIAYIILGFFGFVMIASSFG